MNSNKNEHSVHEKSINSEIDRSKLEWKKGNKRTKKKLYREERSMLNVVSRVAIFDSGAVKSTSEWEEPQSVEGRNEREIRENELAKARRH